MYRGFVLMNLVLVMIDLETLSRILSKHKTHFHILEKICLIACKKSENILLHYEVRLSGG